MHPSLWSLEGWVLKLYSSNRICHFSACPQWSLFELVILDLGHVQNAFENAATRPRWRPTSARPKWPRFTDLKTMSSMTPIHRPTTAVMKMPNDCNGDLSVLSRRDLCISSSQTCLICLICTYGINNHCL